MKNSKKLLKILAGIFIVLLITVSSVSLYLYYGGLKKIIENQILPKVLKSAGEKGFFIKMSSYDMKGLSGIQFKGIDIITKDYPGIEASLKIRELKIDYSALSLLYKKFAGKIYINDIEIYAIIDKNRFAPSEEEFSLDTYAGMLFSDLPIKSLSLKTQINRLKTGIIEKVPKRTSNIYIEKALANVYFSKSSDIAKININMDLPDKTNTLEVKESLNATYLNLSPIIGFQTNINISKKEDTFSYSVPEIDSDIEFRNFFFKDAKKLSINTAKTEINLKSKINDSELQNYLSINIPALTIPGTEKPASISIISDINLNKKRKLTLNGKIDINDFNAATVQAEFNDNENSLFGAGTLSINYAENIKQIITSLKEFPFDSIKAVNNFSLNFNHGSESILQASEIKNNFKGATLSVDSLFSLKPGKSLADISSEKLSKIKIYSSLEILKSITRFSTRGRIPSLPTKFGELLNTNFNISGNVPFDIVKMKIDNTKEIELVSKIAVNSLPELTLSKLNINDFPIINKDWTVIISKSLNLSRENLAINSVIKNASENIKFDLKGRSDFSMKETNLTGSILFKPSFSSKSDIAKGSIKIPFDVISASKRQFDIKGKLVFNDFSLSNKQFSVLKLEGEIPIKERIKLLDNNKIAFAYVHSENPFSRADYKSIKPYMSDFKRYTLKADKIAGLDISVGPMFADIIIDQNIIRANSLSLNLFNGDMDAKIFINIAKSMEQIGLIGLITGIDPLLLSKTGKKEETENKRISGQMDLIYNINSSDIEGRIDINEIGREQLTNLANALDPNWEDENLVTLRKTLKIAYPTYVGVKMERGFFDLKVRMPLLKLVKSKGELAFYGLPLTPVVAMYSEDLKKIIKSSPLN